MLHHDDGPAVIKPNGSRYWYRNGRLHRDDGPAIEYRGTLTDFDFAERMWLLSGAHGNYSGVNYIPPSTCIVKEIWAKNGKYHREDGPAVVCIDGSGAYYIEGEAVTQEECKAMQGLKELSRFRVRK